MNTVVRWSIALIIIFINFFSIEVFVLLANEDCNGNGVIDSIDIENGNELDCDQNGVPDSCQLSGMVEDSFNRINLFSSQEKIVASDINNDGYSDIVSGNWIFYNMPRGQSQFLPAWLVGRSERSDDFCVADFTGDGIPDFMGLDSRNERLILTKGNPVGHPETIGQYDIDLGGLNNIVSGDIDQDGTPDAVISTGGHIIVVPLTPTGPKEGLWPRWSARSSQLCVADFNNDGNLDCITVGELSDKSELSLLEGLPGGGFFNPKIKEIPVRHLDLACGNLWGDSRPEIIVATESNTLIYRVDELFDLEQVHEVSLGGWVRDVLVKDLNSDGSDDLVATLTNDHLIKVLMSSPDEETFLDPISYSVPARPWNLAIADLDNDQAFEILCNHTQLHGLTSVEIRDGFSQDRKVYTESGHKSFQLIKGDFNGDEFIDLCVLNRGDSGRVLTTFINDGEGNYGEKVVSSIDFRGSQNAIAGDFNNDGDLDLIVVISPNQQYALFCRGNGNGRLSAPVHLPGAFTSTLFLEALHHDEDGNLDLYAARGNSIYLWKGSGDGNFTKIKLTDSHDRPRIITVADYDQNGFNDVVTASQWGATYIHWGRDDGTLTTPELLPEPAMATEIRSDAKWKAKSADLNDDGLLDIAAIVSEGEGLAVYLNLGNRDFLEGKFYQIHSKLNELEIADFDLDGVVDIATSSEFSTGDYLSLLRGRGDGNFYPPQERLVSTEFVRGMVQDDYNNDGEPDLAFLLFSDELHILFSNYIPRSQDCNQDGVLDSCQEDISDSIVCPSSLPPYLDCNENQIHDQVEISRDPSKDCDQDGVLDSCVTTIGPFKARKTSVILSNSFPSLVQAAEATGDDKTDILITHEDSNQITLLRQEEPRQFTKLQLSTIREANDLAVADFNMDTYPDIACIIEGVHESALAILFGLGGGEFEEAQEFPTHSTSFGSISAGDFNGDTKADLVLTSSNGHAVQVLIGLGDGTFNDPVVYSPLRILTRNDSPYPSSYRKVRVADLDGDGFDDVIFAYGFGESIAFFFGSAEGEMTPAESIYVFGGPTDLSFSDIDLDGDLDVLCSRGRASAGIVFNLGGRKFSRYRGLLPSESSTSISSGDINHDGVPDLAVAVNREGYLGVYLGQGDGSFQPDRKLSAGSEPFALVLSDVDGDNWMDILSVDVDLRHLSIFYGEDNTIQNPEAIDCNENEIPDLCELNSDQSLDCNENGLLDSCEIQSDATLDCNENGILDFCELTADPSLDCNENGLLDSCEIQSGSLIDTNFNNIPDSCESQGCMIPGDCNSDDVLDITDAVCLLTVLFVNGEQELPCGDGRFLHPANIQLLDWGGDNVLDITDPVSTLRFLFLADSPHILAVPGEELTGCVPILSCPE